MVLVAMFVHSFLSFVLLIISNTGVSTYLLSRPSSIFPFNFPVATALFSLPHIMTYLPVLGLSALRHFSLFFFFLSDQGILNMLLHNHISTAFKLVMWNLTLVLSLPAMSNLTLALSYETSHYNV